jgi:hypothetical protein
LNFCFKIKISIYVEAWILVFIMKNFVCYILFLEWSFEFIKFCIWKQGLSWFWN